MHDKRIPKEIPVELLELRAQMARYRIRPLEVASRARVKPSVVSHVLSATGTSQRVLNIIREMIREKASAKECTSLSSEMQV